MTTGFRYISMLCVLLCPALTAAQVLITDPWVRGTVPAQKATGAFMQLKAEAPAKLVAASSPVAGMVEIHEMKMEGGMMQMRAIDALPLAAGKVVTLAPGGYHIMLMDLKQQLKEGELVPITLQIEGADKTRRSVEVKAMVRPLTAKAAK